MIENIDTLVISPHPDDDVIGVGGTIVNMVREGREIGIVYLTSGEQGNREIEPNDLGPIREEEAKSAAEVLGVSEGNLVFARYPNNHDFDNIHPIAKYLAAIFLVTRPESIFVPHLNDPHPDHKIANLSAIAGIEDLSRGDSYFRDSVSVFGYEVWQDIKNIGVLEIIDSSLSEKIEAIRRHKSQLIKTPYDQLILDQALARGSMIGSLAAEAFSKIY
jgi:LmbE family N-acetylglucosaminyl deacetylase